MNRVDVLQVSLICFAASFFLSNFLYKKNIKIGNKERSTFGGLVLIAVVLLGILISPLRGDYHLWKLFLLFASMFILGFVDDYKHLSPYVKLLAELFIISAAVFSGFRTQIVYFPGYINYIVSIAWMLVISNEFNFLDIMDGLSLGSIILIALTFVIIGLINFQPFNLLFASVLLSGCLGFFPFNYRKASAYLGDSGSLSVGLLIAILAISFSYAGETNPIALFTPIIIFGLPIFDFIYVTLRRIRQGKSIMQKSPDHLAIVMKTNGISVKRITNRFWLISVGFSLTALLLQFGSNLLGLLALVVSVFLFLETALKCYKRT